MSAATIFWIMWGLTIVGLLVVGRRHHRETRRTWIGIGTGKIGGVQTQISRRLRRAGHWRGEIVSV